MHFRNLAEYALNCLVTPISNAGVERMFSIVSLVKTKGRSRMKLPLLESLIRIRSSSSVLDSCCHEFKPTELMLERFNAKNMYSEDGEEKDVDDLMNVCDN